MKVLLVDDSPARIQKLSTLFYCHEVLAVKNCEQALAHLSDKVFDLVSLDYDLADSNTESIARFIASYCSDPPLVLIHSENPEGVKCLRNILPDAIVLSFSLAIIKSSFGDRLKRCLASSTDVSELRDLIKSSEQ